MRLKFRHFTETKSDERSRTILPKCPRSAVILLDSNQSNFFPSRVEAIPMRRPRGVTGVHTAEAA